MKIATVLLFTLAATLVSFTASADYTIEPRSHSLGLNQRVFRVNGNDRELIFDNNVKRFNIQNVFSHDHSLLIIGYKAYAGSAPSKVMAFVSYDDGEHFNGPYDFGYSTSPKNRSFVQFYDDAIYLTLNKTEGLYLPRRSATSSLSVWEIERDSDPEEVFLYSCLKTSNEKFGCKIDKTELDFEEEELKVTLKKCTIVHDKKKPYIRYQGECDSKEDVFISL